jgi:hypothetical protein
VTIDGARRFLAEHGLRMTISDDGGRPWYAVRAGDSSVLSAAPSYMLAVRRARAALRKRASKE